jgi:hypothetical protein
MPAGKVRREISNDNTDILIAPDLNATEEHGDLGAVHGKVKFLSSDPLAQP